MGKPKKRTSPRKTGTRRSHLVLKLARAVNAKSPIKIYTTRRESAKPIKKQAEASSPARKSAKKAA
jgi:ribosomal protein L32